MTDDHTKRQRLRELIAADSIVVAPGAHDGLTAKLVERAGFSAVYLTGAGVANTLLGVPDVGLITLTEMAWVARCVAGAVEIPVVADADTGYGNAINMLRTVREYEKTGVAGIHLEDQMSPKRCGHIAGKEVISTEEMIGKIKAAVDARTDPDFLMIARTDARGPLGLEEAIQRANLYAEAGAEMVFPDALLSEEELARFARSVPSPKMVNMGGYAASRTTPKLPVGTVERLGFKLVIYPLAMLRAGVRAMSDFLVGLGQRGTAFEVEHIAGLKGHPVENWYEFMGISEVRRLEERYLPPAVVETKYAAGEGYRP